MIDDKDEMNDAEKISWLKNVMREDVFRFIFSNEDEVKKWYARIQWHIHKSNELSHQNENLIIENNELREKLDVFSNSIYLTKEEKDALLKVLDSYNICCCDLKTLDNILTIRKKLIK